jgi:hypothetical protein
LKLARVVKVCADRIVTLKQKRVAAIANALEIFLVRIVTSSLVYFDFAVRFREHC